MSSSLPLFRPPMSERLRLCPIPPRARSGPQSPDKSAGLAVWAPSVGENAAAAISAIADTTRTIRISRLPPSPALSRRRSGGTRHWVRHQFFAVGQHDPVQRPDRRAVLGGEDVDRHLVAGVHRLPGPATFQHDEGRLGIGYPVPAIPFLRLTLR